jgi:hypothetical protein
MTTNVFDAVFARSLSVRSARPPGLLLNPPNGAASFSFLGAAPVRRRDPRGERRWAGMGSDYEFE